MSDVDLARMRRVATSVLPDSAELDEVKEITRGSAEGEIMVRASGDSSGTNRNMFAMGNLEGFLEAGYLATSVGAGPDHATAWFKPIDISITID